MKVFSRLVYPGIFVVFLLASASALACWQCVPGGQYCEPDRAAGGTHCDLQCIEDTCTCMTSGHCSEADSTDARPEAPRAADGVLKTGECDRVVLPAGAFSDADLEVLENAFPEAFRLLDTLLSKSEEGIVMGPLQGMRARLDEERDGLEPLFRFDGFADYQDGELLIVFDLDGHDQYAEFIISVNGEFKAEDRFEVSTGTVTALGHAGDTYRQVMW